MKIYLVIALLAIITGCKRAEVYHIRVECYGKSFDGQQWYSIQFTYDDWKSTNTLQEIEIEDHSFSENINDTRTYKDAQLFPELSPDRQNLIAIAKQFKTIADMRKHLLYLSNEVSRQHKYYASIKPKITPLIEPKAIINPDFCKITNIY